MGYPPGYTPTRGNLTMNGDIELTRGQLGGFLRRGLPSALLLAAVLCVGLFYWSSRSTPVFRAQVVLVAKSPQVDLRSLGLPDVNYAPLHVNAYSVAVSSRPVLQAALEAAGLGHDEAAVTALANEGLKVDVSPEAQLIYVTVTENSATAAANVANSLGLQLQEWDRTRITDELQRVANMLTQRITLVQVLLKPVQGATPDAGDPTLVANRQLLSELTDQREAVLALMSSVPSTLTLLKAATPPSTGVFRHPVAFGLLGLILGAILAYGLTFLFELFSPRTYTAGGLTLATGLPVIAELETKGRRAQQHQVLTEDMAIMVQGNLRSTYRQGVQLTLLVAGLEPQDDSAAAAMALAESFAMRQMRTLLVDADVRAPEIARRYRVPGINALPLMDAITAAQGSVRPFRLRLPSGAILSLIYEANPLPNEAMALVNSLPSAVARWQGEYDCIILRTAPVSITSDALMLSDSCNGLVLAVQPGQANRRRLQTAVDTLQRSGVTILGLIATAKPPRRPPRASRRSRRMEEPLATPIPQVEPPRSA